MKYKGYTGIVEFDEESGSLYGRVIGLRDVITFQGESVAGVTQAFRDSVDDYLEFCAKRGRTPEKPYSGQFVLRIDPRLHRALSHAAEEKGQSLTSLVEQTLAERFLGPTAGPAHEMTMGRGARPPARPRGSRGKAVPVPETLSGHGPGDPVRPARKGVKRA